MTEELVYANTEDGISQCGVLIRPAGAERRLPILWTHGAWMHFYFPTYVRIGHELARRGYPFLSFNTRGHDLGSLMFRTDMQGDASEFIGAQVGGYLWETFDEQRADIRAWIEFCEASGFEGVVLAGHSLGATRVVHYQSSEQDPRVRAMIAASPAPMQAWEPDADQVAQAQEMVAEGRGQEIMEAFVTNPWPLRRTAQNFASLVGVIETFGGADGREPRVASINCPLLLTLGDNEAWNGPPEQLEVIREAAKASPRVDTRIFAGSQHNYWGHEEELAEVIAAWLDEL